MTKKKSAPNPETARQAAYGQRIVDAGGKRVVLLLNPEEARVLAQMADAHGGQKAAILKGLDALQRRANALTDAEILDLLRARLARG